MKKFTYVLVVALAITTLLSTAALAGDKPGCGACPSKTACADASKASASLPDAPHKCCIESAAKGKACCGKDAKTVAASVSAYNASQAALKDMHKCCAEAVVAGKGCCGKDAKATHAAYEKQVATCSAVLGGMEKCCAEALANGKGCHGKSAEELKASVGAACDAHKSAAKATGLGKNKG